MKITYTCNINYDGDLSVERSEEVQIGHPYVYISAEGDLVGVKNYSFIRSLQFLAPVSDDLVRMDWICY